MKEGDRWAAEASRILMRHHSSSVPRIQQHRRLPSSSGSEDGRPPLYSTINYRDYMKTKAPSPMPQKVLHKISVPPHMSSCPTGTQAISTNQEPITPSRFSHRLARRDFARIAREKLRLASCWSLAACVCVNPCIPLSMCLTREELQEYFNIYVKVGVPVDPENPAHKRLLEAYWRLIYPSVEAPAIPDWKWQLAGFQSSSPWTDFRGGGLIALQLMFLFAQRHPHFIKRILMDCLSDVPVGDIRAFDRQKLMRSELYYPFSAAFINISFALICYLRLNSDFGHQLAKRSDLTWPAAEHNNNSLDNFLDDAHRPLLVSSAERFGDSPAPRTSVAPPPHNIPYLKKGPKAGVKNFGTVMAADPFDPSRDLFNAQFVKLFCLAAIRCHREWCRSGALDSLMGFGVVLTTVMTAVNSTLTNDSIVNDPHGMKQLMGLD
eukprot:Gregarina_sp_Poly_1__10643@NODE_79_length_15751_cov_81_561464_g67_i0_p4_GENE_NODE_79_length_15751_cov_81_561464_g67_i0NODE_79_length_15751_cov_81_561464_g67_i0_p4_ORF_typecomplete_len435_score40_79ELMO_CED12/PF04727_13/3_6e31_NODE_79_length_15751_cov_81_561464_g67_i021483452